MPNHPRCIDGLSPNSNEDQSVPLLVFLSLVANIAYLMAGELGLILGIKRSCGKWHIRMTT
jgi:hypothetical protein